MTTAEQELGGVRSQIKVLETDSHHRGKALTHEKEARQSSFDKGQNSIPNNQCFASANNHIRSLSCIHA
jgi:hypothetical protein